MCRRDYPRYRYIGRTMEINCQQIFPTQKGSHYIHVRGGETEPYIPVQTEQVDETIAAV
ncbi:hypothetical protein BDV26DRAFT_276968 [Aspergillus bertholletiae]|uniref:Uncharacterized protein n=1 Tax=Aspergillus bertholletiae TaxID=1226010 RepID=A0A5N7AM36_9EURO|nr:hypothetical protein BDV26DRAFT_276968 [Aspergillus bertholletiae]